MDPLRAYFESLSSDWDGKQPSNRTEILSNLLAPHKHLIASSHSILELGSGTGALSPLLSACCPEAIIISLDLSYHMLLMAKPHKNGNHLVESDAHFLPFNNNSFDIAVCHNCFPHLSDKSFALKEFQRVLLPESWLLILHDQSRDKINEIHRNSSNPIIQKHQVPPLKDMIQLLEERNCTLIQVEDTSDHFTAIGRMPA